MLHVKGHTECSRLVSVMKRGTGSTLHVKGHTECSRLVSVMKRRTRSKTINVTCKRTYRMF